MLAQFAWERGEVKPAAEASPIYLRDTVAWKKLLDVNNDRPSRSSVMSLGRQRLNLMRLDPDVIGGIS